jgi:hypothetical protein
MIGASPPIPIYNLSSREDKNTLYLHAISNIMLF